MMVQCRTLSAVVVALAFAGACNGSRDQSFAGEVTRSWNPRAVKEVKDVPIETLRSEIQRELAKKPTFATDEQWGHVRGLYKGYQNAPLWLDDDGLIKKRADALVDALVSATTDGINIDQYSLFDLASLLDTVRRSDKPTAAQLAKADLLLTIAYASLAEDYLTGQIDPKSVGHSWHIEPQEGEVDSALVRSLRDKDLAEAFKRMRPQDYDYEMLRQKLGDLRKIASAGGWPAIPAGKSLKKGDAEAPARLQALRNRLRTEGISFNGPEGATAFDQSFATALAQFQARHAIVVDSQLGKETLDALNVPATFRLAQIAANLERYRWLPRMMGDKYVFVNVPAFRLEGYENGKKTIEMKVIVGSEYEGRSTPVFSDKMEFVVFRPYWNVTPGIAAKEFFPVYGSNLPAGYETYTEKGNLRIRQVPGPKNSLGLVKFMFPNDFNIYLHDTPNDNLFKKDVRAFSHGCIRLEKPNELAQWVLGWDANRVEQAMQNGPDNRTVMLPKKIPVYIAYMTAYVRDGGLWFGNDLYNRDNQLADAVARGAMPSGEAVRAVEALRQLTD
ncbi:MAG: L,D-transpeptidase family protein [Gemmatimonadaceae bacterium]